MARSFPGTAYITLAPGANASVSALTWVAVLRPNVANVVQYVLALPGAGGNSGIRLGATGTITASFNSAGYSPGTPVSYTPADGWVLIAVTKDAGTMPFRLHKYTYATDAWVRSTSSGSYAGPTNPITGVRLGGIGGSGLNGDLAAVATYDHALSDNQLEAFPHSLHAWHALAPSALWLLDQLATTQRITDLTGQGGNQTSTTGTSTVAGTGVPGLSYGHPPIYVGRPPFDTLSASAHLSAASQLTASGRATRSASAALSAASGLAVASELRRLAATHLSASSGLQVRPAAVGMTASSGLTVSGQRLRYASVHLSAASTLAVDRGLNQTPHAYPDQVTVTSVPSAIQVTSTPGRITRSAGISDVQRHPDASDVRRTR